MMELLKMPLVHTVCEGCLSIDRKLNTLTSEASKHFTDLLNDHPINTPPLLCWECLALVQKTRRFKEQLKTANQLLVQYVFQQTTKLKSLSTLSHTHSTAQHIAEHTQSLGQHVKEQYNHTAHTQTSAAEPLAFVKIEDGDDDYFDEKDNYLHNEEKYKTALISDPTNEVETKCVNHIVRKKTEEEFNESDEEPLNRKKKDAEVKQNKQRGRRKKKMKDEKVDKRKNPGPKREKPAGVVENPRVHRKLQQLNMSSGELEMVVLSWDEVESERQKALNSVVFTRHQYRCYGCVLGFNHKFKLENHMQKHDASNGGEVCSVCGVVCRDANALCAHRRRHRLRWRCVLCGGLWSRAGVAADHAARAHALPAPTHACALCPHVATSLGKLRNHLKNHGERQKCELCGKTFRDKTSLRTHLFIHKGEKEYSCPRCNKQFLFKKAMEVHLVTHEAPAQLYCHQCDMNFKNRMSYYQHMKYNLKHIDPAKLKYACKLCDKKFVKAARLEEHHLAIHLKATPIKCVLPGCSFACSSRPVLRTHVRVVHRNARATRNHVCDTCGKTYTTKKILEGHIRSHTGERPFQCKLCPSTFGYEAALYNHNKLVHLKTKSVRRSSVPVTTATEPWQPLAQQIKGGDTCK